MTMPTRRTRRNIAYTLTGSLVAIILWMLAPGDIGDKEASLAMVIVPSIIGGLIGFITGETYSDHSERKVSKKDEQ